MRSGEKSRIHAREKTNSAHLCQTWQHQPKGHRYRRHPLCRGTQPVLCCVCVHVYVYMCVCVHVCVNMCVCVSCCFLSVCLSAPLPPLPVSVKHWVTSCSTAECRGPLCKAPPPNSKKHQSTKTQRQAQQEPPSVTMEATRKTTFHFRSFHTHTRTHAHTHTRTHAHTHTRMQTRVPVSCACAWHAAQSAP